MKKHQGEIIELATRNSGYSIKQVATRMGISRSTLYNRFEDSNLSDNFIFDISEIIHHDFSKELPHLKDHPRFKGVEEKHITYLTPNTTELLSTKKKYYQLLEKHNKLLSIIIKVINTKASELPMLQKEIMNFIEESIK